ncbi:MAG: hypothetical protein ACK4F5_17240, partial [Aliihoeflea sp.]
VQHQPHSAFAHLRGKLVRGLAHDAPSYSGVGASGKPGAVHYRLKLSLVRVGRIEGDPEEDEASVIIVAASFGTTDPADGAMSSQPHGFGKTRTDSALLGLQGSMFESILHRSSPFLKAGHGSPSKSDRW